MLRQSTYDIEALTSQIIAGRKGTKLRDYVFVTVQQFLKQKKIPNNPRRSFSLFLGRERTLIPATEYKISSKRIQFFIGNRRIKKRFGNPRRKPDVCLSKSNRNYFPLVGFETRRNGSGQKRYSRKEARIFIMEATKEQQFANNGWKAISPFLLTVDARF